MSLWSWLCTTVGDTWCDPSAVAIWPWPATVVGVRHGEMLWSDYRVFTRLLRPGDFLLMRSKPFVGSNTGIPGALKHLAIYVGAVRGLQNRDTHFIESVESLGVKYESEDRHERNIHQRCCVHAISEGVVAQDLGEVLMHADYAMAVRPWSPERPSEQSILVTSAISQLGKPYDFDFNQQNDKAIFCTELGLYCVRRAAIIPPVSMRMRVKPFRAKIEVVLADYFTYYPPVCCSESCLSPRFQRRSMLGGAFQDAVARAWVETGK